jgi:hypothetical protein
MILMVPNPSQEHRCYRFYQRNFLSKEQSGEDMVLSQLSATKHCRDGYAATPSHLALTTCPSETNVV